MRQPATLPERIRGALHVQRSFLLVWKASKKWTILSVFLTVVKSVFPLLGLYVMKLIVDTVTDGISSGYNPDLMHRVVWLVIAAFVVAVIQSALSICSSYVSEVQTAVLTDYISTMLHDKSLGLDLAYYENPQYYDTLHRAQQEGVHRPGRIVNGLVQILRNGVSFTAMVGLLFVFHWSVALLIILSTVPGVIVQAVFSRKYYNWQKERTQMQRKTSYFSSILTGGQYAKELRLFQLGDFFSRAFLSLRKVLRGEQLSLSRKRGFADFTAQAFSSIILFCCLFFIALRALHGLITVGDMVMYYQAFQRAVSALKGLFVSIVSLYEDNMFVGYFFEFLDIKNRIVDPENPRTLPEKIEQSIAFEHVSFQYPGQRDLVLKDVSFSVGPGEVVALVGANGAGKSTIVKLLCRLYDPEKGRILLDGIPLSEFRPAELRRMISAVFQDFARYHLTARDNIRFGDITLPPDAKEVEEAAVKANVHDFINKLPQGFDTMLGRWFQSGEELSMGEWQKIVLARAFLRKASFIILDEPTSSLDTLTEYHLFTKFKELIEGRSALIISHRFSTVRMADRIYVLSDGRVAEHGTHEELMAENGIYADMYNKQAAWLKIPG